jgi:hypothetical protein
MRQRADQERHLEVQGQEPEHRRIRVLSLLLVGLFLPSLGGCKEKPKPPERRPGFEDCDAKYDNGDETNLKTDVRHCGRCGNVCSEKNGTTSCVNGECKPVCAAGFAACGIPNEGCNAKLASDAAHCGGCGKRCFTGYCSVGACVDSEIIQSDVYSYGVLIRDQKFVYMNKAGSEKSFSRYPLAGGKLEKVPVREFVPYLFDGKDYYGCREVEESAPLDNKRYGSCQLMRGPLEGPAKSIAKIERYSLGALALSGDTLYYGTMVPELDSDQGAIHSLSLAGGEPKLVATVDDPVSILVKDGTVFYASGGTRKQEHKDAGLYRIEAGKPKLVYRGRARSLELDGDYIYFNGADVVMRIKATGGYHEPELVAAPPPRWRGGIFGLALTDTHVYYAIRGKDVNFTTLARIKKPKPS